MSTKVYKCTHCARLLETRQEKGVRLCWMCQKIPVCEICGIIMCDGMSGHIAEKSSNPNRCTDCEFVEERVRKECGFCGSKMSNSLNNYKQHGNMCVLCTKEVNERLNSRKYEVL